MEKAATATSMLHPLIHFDAPSVDNYMNYHIDNVGGSTLDGLAIKWVELFEGSDPAHVISKTSLVKE